MGSQSSNRAVLLQTGADRIAGVHLSMPMLVLQKG